MGNPRKCEKKKKKKTGNQLGHWVGGTLLAKSLDGYGRASGAGSRQKNKKCRRCNLKFFGIRRRTSMGWTTPEKNPVSKKKNVGPRPAALRNLTTCRFSYADSSHEKEQKEKTGENRKDFSK